MSQTTGITGDHLVNALPTLDVNFILGGEAEQNGLHRQPERLIVALAKSNESRLRLSLIPLFLEHPEFAGQVRTAAKRLDPTARLTLQSYLSAALWIAKKHKLPVSLPDHFSQELNLQPTEDPENNLRALAKRHGELSSTRVNWYGTFLHAEKIWQMGLEYFQEVKN